MQFKAEIFTRKVTVFSIMASCTDIHAQLMIQRLWMISMMCLIFQKNLFPTKRQCVDSQYTTVVYIKEKTMGE